MKKILLLSFILLILNSCGGSKKTVAPQSEHKTSKKIETKVKSLETSDKNLDFATLRYIAKYEDVAKKEMKEYGVPASITLAQGVLESQAGKSRLAVEGKNHFGIKCHDDWQGEKILHDDNKAQECFRKYNNAAESFKDHSKFLAGRKRYAFLFRLPKTDYEAWARGLKKAGYATDPSYPDKLIYIINKYNLSKLDKDVLSNMSVKVSENENNHQTQKKKFIYEVQEGETLFTISRKFNVPVKDIQRINNLNDFDIYKGQILVLTESDNNAVSEPVTTQESSKNEPTVADAKDKEVVKETTEVTPQKTEVNDKNITLHVVKQGETLFSLSQSFKVDIETLRQLNNLKDGKIAVGSVIKIPTDKTQGQEKIEEPKAPTSSPTQTQKDKGTYHIVQPGETLYRIHINYKVSIKKLRKLNHLRGNYIKVGQKIRVK